MTIEKLIEVRYFAYTSRAELYNRFLAKKEELSQYFKCNWNDTVWPVSSEIGTLDNQPARLKNHLITLDVKVESNEAVISGSSVVYPVQVPFVEFTVNRLRKITGIKFETVKKVIPYDEALLMRKD